MTTASARTRSSAFSEITEGGAGRLVHDEQEAALYEACPSAFWLAPGDPALLRTQTGPTLPAPHQILYAGAPLPEPVEVELFVSGRNTAVARAMLAAGPIFMALLMLMLGKEEGWRSIGAALIVPVVTLPLTMIVGTVLGFGPILLGVLALGWLGTRFDLARERWLWSVTGGACGLALAGLFDAGPVGTLPLLLTSAACATIAHHAVTWDEPEPA